ncbi:MAG: MFS transporter, partial [Actinomycetota bacterium]|nr:MFS transporter [Actinomycetota bacterium]
TRLRELPALLRRNRDFRLLFAATVVSFLGDWFAFVAVSEFAITTTGREGAGAVAFAANVLPVFVVAPFAGVLADRVDRRLLFVAVNLAAIMPCLGLLAAFALGQPWLAVGCLAAIALVVAFVEPITAAAVPNLVDPADLSLAQAALGSVWGTMLFVGAGVGGLVTQAFGAQISFVLDALTFVTAAVLVLGIRRSMHQVAPSRAARGDGPAPATASVWSHLGEVWRFVRDRKITKAFMLTKTGVGVGNGIVGLLPAFALTRLGGSALAIGYLFAARGLGALAGPLLGRALARDDGRRLMLVCGGSILAYGLAYAFLPLVSSLPVALLLVALAHLGGGAQWVLSTYGLQVTTPDAIRGRVTSLDFGLATFAVGMSSLLAGAAADVLGLTIASWLMVSLAFLYGLSWLAWTRDLWQSQADPLRTPA